MNFGIKFTNIVSEKKGWQMKKHYQLQKDKQCYYQKPYLILRIDKVFNVLTKAKLMTTFDFT